MEVSETKNSSTQPFPKFVIPCYLAAAVAAALVAISETLGQGNSHLIWTYIVERPGSALLALLVGSFIVLVLPAIHIGVFALIKSKRNLVTFARILKGWSIAILCFYILGFLAGLYNNHVQQQYADLLAPLEITSEDRWAKMEFCSSVSDLAVSAVEAKRQGLTQQQFLSQQSSAKGITDYMRTEIQSAYQQPDNTDLADYRKRVYRSCFNSRR